MADGVEIKVDTTQAIAKLGRVPVAVRDRLRAVLPDMIRRLAAGVSNKLGTQLKSQTSLSLAQQMHEDSSQIYGTVELQSAAAKGLLPTYLEMGTSPHEIKGNPVLAFPWDFMGGYGGSASSAQTSMAFFRRVHHPGTRAYGFMAKTFAEQQDAIVQGLQDAVRSAAQGAR